jgi:hypothetical protein
MQAMGIEPPAPGVAPVGGGALDPTQGQYRTGGRMTNPNVQPMQLPPGAGGLPGAAVPGAPGNIPEVPVPGVVPGVPAPGAVPGVPVPGANPAVPAPAPQPPPAGDVPRPGGRNPQ